MASLTASVNLMAGRRVALRAQAKAPRPMRASRLICKAFARDPAETLGKVTSIIASQLGTEAEKIAPEAKFVDLGADSLDVVEIIMELETQFEIDIDQDDAAKLENVQSVADYIVSK